MSSTRSYFGLEDLQEWVAQGLISPEQLTRIRAYIEAAGLTGEQAQPELTPRKKLNLVSLAYYFGGFMILFAYTVFMGIQWEQLGQGGQVAVSALTIIVLWMVGYFLRHKGFQTAGNLLIFAGT